MSKLEDRVRAVRREQLSRDFMLELDMDAQHIRTLLESLDQQALRCADNVKNRNPTDALIRLVEMREGLRLIAELMGLKIAQG